MPRKLNVVIAHHEKPIADILVMVLKQSSVDAAAAYSGVDALKLVLSTHPDVAILCIVPAYDGDLNGVYAAIVVRALEPDCHIVLLPGGSGGWVIDPLNLALSRGIEFELTPEPVHPDVLFALLTPHTGGDIESIRLKTRAGETDGDATRAHVRDFAPTQPKWTLGPIFKKFTGRE
jgi:hypothetical protein